MTLVPRALGSPRPRGFQLNDISERPFSVTRLLAETNGIAGKVEGEPLGDMWYNVDCCTCEYWGLYVGYCIWGNSVLEGIAYRGAVQLHSRFQEF
jgi:hypothetical protein